MYKNGDQDLKDLYDIKTLMRDPFNNRNCRPFIERINAMLCLENFSIGLRKYHIKK